MSRPQFRFRLATLLLLLAIAAIACGWFSHQRMLGESLKSTRNQLALLRSREPTSEPVDEIFAYAVVGKMQTDGSRQVSTRANYVGKQVQVEGIAWGQPFGSSNNSASPWVQPHISFDGGAIFLKGADFAKDGVKGKLVRVVGVLRESPGFGTRFGDQPKHYYIEVESYEAIEMVKEPLLVALEKITTPIVRIED